MVFNSYQDLILNYADYYTSYLLPSTETSSCSSSTEAGSLGLGGQQDSEGKRQRCAEAQISQIKGSSFLERDGQIVTIGSFNKLTYAEILSVVILFFGFMLAKRRLVTFLRHKTGIKNLGLRPKDLDRLEECIWRLIFYSLSSVWLISTFVKHNYALQFDVGWPGAPGDYSFTVAWDEHGICLVEAAFYLHATYALIFEDVWRKDSIMMLIHHLAAIFAIVGLYATRLHKIALAAIVLRDTCDVLVELTKMGICLHIQHGKRVARVERWTKLSLLIFAVSFCVNQLYYYPLFCLYHILNVVKVFQIKTVAMFGLVTCTMIFLLLDLMWFVLVLRLLYRMFFDDQDPLKDLREYDEGYDQKANKRESSHERRSGKKESD